jgi:hypothetical protein
MATHFVKSATLREFFTTQIESLPNCRQSTKSYIISVFSQPKMEQYNYSNESITLLYAAAKFEPNFQKFQSLGDWLLVAKSLFPASLSEATPEYYDAIAQNCYYKCYTLINKEWPIFEELADTFPSVVRDLQKKMWLLLSSTETTYFSGLSSGSN